MQKAPTCNENSCFLRIYLFIIFNFLILISKRSKYYHIATLNMTCQSKTDID